ncbi:transposase-like protein [Catenulispora sp. MAP12-49]|uniref:hypothetical protein n=1 Tax=Catenulispora sp. MAP12-49 TaxID=3156302 RepID=UPI0035179452
MPKPHPPEFRRRAMELARAGNTPIGQLAKDPGVSYSCLKHWVDQRSMREPSWACRPLRGRS